MADMSKSIKLMAEDSQRIETIGKEAHRQADLEIERFFEANKQASEVKDFEPVAEHINRVIEQTRCFGLAQVLVQELEHITEHINNAMQETKPLFGKVAPENVAKGEVLRAVFLAKWLSTMVEGLNKELDNK